MKASTVDRCMREGGIERLPASQNTKCRSLSGYNPHQPIWLIRASGYVVNRRDNLVHCQAKKHRQREQKIKSRGRSCYRVIGPSRFGIKQTENMGKIKHRILSGILKERELRITSMGHRVMGLSVSRKCMVIGVWFLFTAAISLSLMYGSALLLDRYGLCIYRVSQYSIVDCPLKYYLSLIHI